MQKLPEASDRKRGNLCAKKRDRPDKRRKQVTTSKSPLLLVEGHVATLKRHVG